MQNVPEAMSFQSYVISTNLLVTDDTFILRLTPANGKTVSFQPGQHCLLKNPLYAKPEEAHTFSFASSPETKDYLEFCIRIYGNWTRALSQLKKGDTILISEPLGDVIWTDTHASYVFLVGGVGISPIMSIIRTLVLTKSTHPFTVLFGSRTEQSIVYREELDELAQSVPGSKIVHILSETTHIDAWKGYRGFITEDIIRKEVTLEKKPVFYMYGPPIFVTKMQALLKHMGVADTQVKFELH